MSHDTNHISSEKLADYVEQRLLPAEVQQIEAHLASDCVRCQEELAELSQLITLMQSDDWVAPPKPMQQAVRQAFRDYHSKPSVNHHSKPSESTVSFWVWLQQLLAPRLRVAATAMVLVLLLISGVYYQFWDTTWTVQPTFLTEIDGSIKIEFPKGAEWGPGPSDGSLLPGTLVRTGEESSVALLFFDESVTRLQPNAAVQIMQAQEGDSTNVIALEQRIGQTYYEIATLPTSDSRFEIKTPLALITVRGTKFTVNVAPEGITDVLVSEGVVEVTAQERVMMVKMGEMVTVRPELPPVLVSPTSSPQPTVIHTVTPIIPSPVPTQPTQPTQVATSTLIPVTSTILRQPTRSLTTTSSATPVQEPSPTAEVVETTVVREPTVVPTIVPQPTEVPATTEPTIVLQQPTMTPEPTSVPATAVPQPTITPEPTSVPATAVPQATVIPEPTVVPPTVTSEPTVVPPTVTSEPTVVPPTVTSEPTVVPPTVTSEPTVVSPSPVPQPTTAPPSPVPEPTTVPPDNDDGGEPPDDDDGDEPPDNDDDDGDESDENDDGGDESDENDDGG